jgi:hypothetical protein
MSDGADRVISEMFEIADLFYLVLVVASDILG